MQVLFALLICMIPIGMSAQNTLPEGNDQNGELINSNELLAEGPVLLVFYRGNWCPYCRKHLSELQESLNEIRKAGASVVVVTPESEAAVGSMIEQTGAEFHIISDKGYRIMKDYGLDFKLSKETVPRYFNIVLNKTREANGNEDDILPIPATYLIGTDGKVRFAHYDEDYRNRSAISDILQALK